MILQEYINRRQILLDKMMSKSAVLIFSAPEVLRTTDNYYPYRQNSNFWYFTGLNEPEAMLLLIKNDKNHSQSILFNRALNSVRDSWLGPCLGQENALRKIGVDRALIFNEIDNELYKLLNGLYAIYHAYNEYFYADKIVFNTLDKLRKSSNQSFVAPSVIIDWRPIVCEMRLFKSPEELKVMRRAGEITALAHTRAMRKCRTNLFSYQLESEVLYEFNYHGARYPSYNTIVGSGKNSCILHYTKNEERLRDGDLVLVDAGCEYQGYASDVTRTFPVNGRFTKPQLAIYNIVLESLEKALTLFSPGVSIEEVDLAIALIMINKLIDLSILRGNKEKLLEESAHREFFIHNLTHWLGLDVHDVSFYGNDKSRKLEPGMVLSVEPGLYIPASATIPIEYHNICIRIEENIVITETGNENLTSLAVKKVKKIETLMESSRI